jgi:hypothetical protein
MANTTFATVLSGSPPTPYARVKVGAVTLDTASFTLAPMNAR